MPLAIVVAAPVIAGSTYFQIRRAADDVAAVIVPENFYAVGQWYEDFSQTSDDEVASTSRRGYAPAACVCLTELM